MGPRRVATISATRPTPYELHHSERPVDFPVDRAMT